MALTNDIPADTIVAQSSFGTNFGVSVFVCLIGFVYDVPPFFYIVPLISIFGAILGYTLWMKGHRRLATILGTSGLLFAGILSHSMLQTIGGPTGILLLASVITAGGLGGIIEAGITVALIFLWLGLTLIVPVEEIIPLGEGLREAIRQFTLENPPKNIVIVYEEILLVFVGLSVPCWGIYVVALDLSNKRARLRAEESLNRFEQANKELASKQQALALAHSRQKTISDLGILAATETTIGELISRCISSIIEDHEGVTIAIFEHEASEKEGLDSREDMISENQKVFYRLIRGVNISTDTDLHTNYWPLTREKDILTDEGLLDPNLKSLIAPSVQAFAFHLSEIDNQRILLVCIDQKEPIEGEYVYFLRSISQVLLTRYRRESVLQERAELAARLQREQRLEALSRMAGEVSHDFNNTLTVVSSAVEVVEQNLDMRFSRELRAIKEATRVSATMTNKLLTFCRGYGQPSKPIQIQQVMQSIQHILPQSTDDFVIDLSWDCDLEEIYLAEGQLELIIMNLYSNSRQAILLKRNQPNTKELSSSEHEEGTIAISLRKIIHQNDDGLGIPEGAFVQLLVEDNGIGMDQETQDQVFEPFFSTKKQQGGGLGLAIVHGIVLQNHSYIKIQSSLGVGTQVRIYFPFDVPASSYKRDLAVTTTSEHKNILLIDDEDMVRYAVASQLKIIGNIVFEATDFQSAKKILERNTIGLILTDIRLGSETGLQLVDRIKKLGFHCPIIFMTGYSGGEHLKKYGDTPVLLKPFTTNQLRQALVQCKSDF